MRQLSFALAALSSLISPLTLCAEALAQDAPAAPPAAAPPAADPAPAPTEPDKPKPPAEATPPAKPEAPKEGEPAPADGEEAAAAAAEAEPTDDAAAKAAEEAAAAEAAEAEAAEAEAAEAAMADDAASFSRPPRKGMGVVWGIVKDGVEKDTIPEAQISVPGTKYKTIADFDGRFRLELPPGVYNLRVYVELHRPSIVRAVKVVAGEIDKFEVDVMPDESAVETVEVVTNADKSSVEGQLLTRQRSASVGDGVGRAEISRTPASNAAQASQRIVGATIVGNRFVYVRGLGERYTNALLNGIPLPSPEPDRAAIPLDLFPSLILENVTIVKTFTPDVPADFAGGSVRIETRELPSKPLLQLSVSMGYDSSSTFRERLAQKSSSTDFLGFDGGLRKLPDGFPPNVLVPGSLKPGQPPGGETVTDADLLAAGRSINSSMNPVRSVTSPNYSLGAVAGKGWNLGGERRLGALASLNYGRSFKIRDDITVRQYQVDRDADGNLGQSTTLNLKGEQGQDRVSWGALGSVSFWANQRHRFTLLGLHTQLADSTVQLLQGEDSSRGATLAGTTMRYVSRALNVLQLRGESDFPALNKAELRWYATYSVAGRNEPNTRDTVYQFDDANVRWTGSTGPDNGVHFHSKQNENTKGAGLDWTQPLTKDPDVIKLKVGGLVTGKDRDFAARRFVLGKVQGGPNEPFICPGAEYRIDCPVPVYQYDNVGPVIGFQETTQPADAYKAKLNVYAAYAMFDAKAGRDIRIVGGARMEHTDQSIDPYNQFATGEKPKGAKVNTTDWLPALSLTYSATKTTKFRAAVSQTLARPQIRELAPFVFSDYFGSNPISGNPDLKLTYIKNADLRWEWFPSVREVIAFSFFYKSFTDPIEPYVTASGVPGIINYQNAKGARLLGLELEARKSLGFLTPKLNDLSFIGNLTLARSRIQLGDQGGFSVSTNKSRAMVNQAPYVINLALDYDNQVLGFNARLLYNVLGPRIAQVGTGGLDDVYAQPFHSVDATVSQLVAKHVSIKLTGANLLNGNIRETIGKAGRDDRVTYQYRDGRVITLTATYTQ